MARDKVTLGVSFGSHDAAAAVVIGTTLVAAAEEERFNRLKHTKVFPSGAIESCLRTAGIDSRDVDSVALFLDPRLQWLLPVYNMMAAFPEGFGYISHAASWAKRRSGLAGTIRASGLFRPDCEITFVPHHQAHAASAYLLSPFDDALIVTVDGRGEYETLCTFEGSGGALQFKHRVTYPHSIGYLYSAVTAFLGFKPQSDEYKVMGLAAYGTPALVDRIGRLARFDSKTGKVILDLDYFDHHRAKGKARTRFSQRFVEEFGSPRKPGEPVEAQHSDLAYATQWLTEKLLGDYIGFARGLVKSRNLCLAGGVALNCVANAVLAQRSDIDQLFVPPAPNDAGAAVGAALAAAMRQAPGSSRTSYRGGYLGPEFSDVDIEAAIGRLVTDEFTVTRCQRPAEEASRLLDEGRIIGWFQGRMEFGPRALGARSILATPTSRAMRDRLNLLIKRREEFRPFAPAVLEREANTYFRLADPARQLYPFMLATAEVRPEYRDRLPAIVHVDGTARLQTVSSDTNPLFAELLELRLAKTGLGVVLNTSFNVAGEPIVCNPEDAIRSFSGSGLDALVIGNWVVERQGTANC